MNTWNDAGERQIYRLGVSVSLADSEKDWHRFPSPKTLDIFCNMSQNVKGLQISGDYTLWIYGYGL